MHTLLFIPQVWGYIGIIWLSVCQHCVLAITSYSLVLSGYYILHNYFPWPSGVSWPWTKVIYLRSRCTHSQNPCPGHNSLLPSWVWIMVYSIVVHGSRVCQSLGSKSYIQVQGHSAHIPKICVRAITPYCLVGSG